MINDTMNKIEDKVKKSIHITDENKNEYLLMLSMLRQEIANISLDEKDKAETITGFAGMTVHEATREEQNQKLLDISMEGLKLSMDGFEVTHPELVSVVNSFCALLSNIGI